MVKKRRTIIIAAVLLLLIVGIAKWVYEGSALSRYHAAVARQYAGEIALIENASRALPAHDDRSDEAWTRRESLRAEVESALGIPEIFAASWSDDGHHGSQILRWSGGGSGFSTIKLFCHYDLRKRHAVFYGWTSAGKPLIVFEGNPVDGVKRQYRIAFLTDALDSR